MIANVTWYNAIIASYCNIFDVDIVDMSKDVPRIWTSQFRRSMAKACRPACIATMCDFPWKPTSDTSTSSTAQGGGGSFKNRKPIGEVGCGESQMAERIH